MARKTAKIITITTQKDNFVIAAKSILKKKNIAAAITSTIIISYIEILNFCIVIILCNFLKPCLEEA
jgi:hypothetical protein